MRIVEGRVLKGLLVLVISWGWGFRDRICVFRRGYIRFYFELIYVYMLRIKRWYIGWWLIVIGEEYLREFVLLIFRDGFLIFIKKDK